MSQEKQFLVAGATLKCPYGTKECKLLSDGDCGAMMIADKLFLSVKATKTKQNIEGFGMCTSKYCEGNPQVCMAKMRPAERWMNPVMANEMLSVHGGEKAIHKDARLLCLFGRTYIVALTTGQDELTESEKQFYKNMRDIFGFDDDVIAIMLKVIHAIDQIYPNETEREKAWRFARLMGGFTYGYGAEDKFIEMREELKKNTDKDISNEIKQMKDTGKWIMTAGKSEDEKYFIEVLNLSSDEYKKLRFSVMAQHEITSRPATCFPGYMKEPTHPYYSVWKSLYEDSCTPEEFEKEWERLYKKYLNVTEDTFEMLLEDTSIFSDYAQIEKAAEKYSLEPKYSDFSHQQILTATILLDEDKSVDNVVGALVESYIDSLPSVYGLEHVLGNVAEKKAEGFVGDYRTSLAGWLGDIRLADSKMSEDDYKADLDGLNISSLIINEDMNTIEAINNYYEAVNSGTTTREKDFLCNMGGGNAQEGLEKVKDMDNLLSIKQNLPNDIKDFFSGTESPAVIGDQISAEFIERIEAGLE